MARRNERVRQERAHERAVEREKRIDQLEAALLKIFE
jgi:hypothetical protein